MHRLRVVGVAVPESAGTEPTLDLAAPPPAVGSEWTLTRTVGPMLVADARPSPTERRRLWTMTDAVSNSTIAVTETTTPDARTVNVAIS